MELVNQDHTLLVGSAASRPVSPSTYLFPEHEIWMVWAEFVGER
jgi:hypothetical protein